MNKRFGVEASLGIGSGTVSKRSQKNLEKAENFCRRGRPLDAIPYLEASVKDSPNNLDAVIQLAFLTTRRNAIKILEKAEGIGRTTLKRGFGDDFFESNQSVGRFWAILETRPYLRVLQALVRLYFEESRYQDSANTIIEMLRLCPGDNLGQRTWLGSILIRVGRYADALHFAQMWLHPWAREGKIPPRGGTAFESPSPDPMPTEQEESYSRFGPGNIMHTAALASFHLWGDIPQSRQYLKLAAMANRNILLKILARVPRPSELNMQPRALNGPEDAQDYLWLTQDLWMEAEVWEWANTSQDVRKVILKVCSREECSVTETRVAEFKRCGACHQVSYCSPECQKMDWPNHKSDCHKHKQLKEIRQSIAKGKMPTDSQVPTFFADFSEKGSVLRSATGERMG